MRVIWAILFIAGVAPAIAQEKQMFQSVPTTTMTIQSRSYTFEPLPDITTFELALATKAILPFVAQRNAFASTPIEIIDNLPPEVKRHFKQHNAR